jgi:hypothetical protein
MCDAAPCEACWALAYNMCIGDGDERDPLNCMKCLECPVCKKKHKKSEHFGSSCLECSLSQKQQKENSVAQALVVQQHEPLLAEVVALKAKVVALKAEVAALKA